MRSCSSPPTSPPLISARIFSRSRQRRAFDLDRRVPQSRAHDCLRTLIEHLLYPNHQHAARRLTLHSETCAEFRVCGDRGATHNAQRLAHTRNEEQQRDARVRDEISQAVDAIVAGGDPARRWSLRRSRERSPWDHPAASSRAHQVRWSPSRRTGEASTSARYALVMRSASSTLAGG